MHMLKLHLLICYFQLTFHFTGSPRQQQSHTLLRSSLKPGMVSSYYTRSSGVGQNISTTNTLSRRQRPLDYASDTEATCSSSQRSSYYYYRDRPQTSG